MYKTFTYIRKNCLQIENYDIILKILYYLKKYFSAVFKIRYLNLKNLTTR